MHNTIIYLLGPSGVGKYSVGQLLSERTGAKFLHNHYWLNIILGLVEKDGTTPFPDRVWDLAGEVRKSVFATMAELSPAGWSLIITHAGVGDPDDVDEVIISDVAKLAEDRDAPIYAFSLTCSPDELAERVQSPDRKLMMKTQNPKTARENATLPPLDPGLGHHAVIDTTGLSATEVADRILQHLA